MVREAPHSSPQQPKHVVQRIPRSVVSLWTLRGNYVRSITAIITIIVVAVIITVITAIATLVAIAIAIAVITKMR
jgi:hypothetical protein